MIARLPARSTALLVVLAATATGAPEPARAQAEGGEAADTPTLGEVVVRSRRSIEQRFFSAGSLVVVDRRDIEQLGADTIGDVLRQLPGVQITTNANGSVEIRMRGMDASATRVLVDGQRVTGRAQLPFDQLPAELIERIDVLRAPTAEHAGASGGTINFVLRQATARRETSIRLTNNHVWDRNAAQFFVSRSGPLGEARPDAAPQGGPKVPPPAPPWSYFVSLSGGELLLGSDVARHQRSNGPARFDLEADTRMRRNEWTLLPRLQGRLGPRDQVNLNATFTSTEWDGRQRSAGQGVSVGGAPYTTQAVDPFLTRRSHAQATLDWSRRFDTSKLETTFSTARSSEKVDREGRSEVSGERGGTQTHYRFEDDRRERQIGIKSKLSGTDSPLLWTAGIEFDQRRLDVDTERSTAGAPEASAAEATLRRTAVWTDREWELPASTTLTLGLRAESVHARALSSDADGSRRSTLRETYLQPSLHTRTPIGEALQWRSNLAHITRTPRIWDLIDRTIPSQGANSVNNPDYTGNPDLRPETAWTLDTGFERRLGADGLAGLSLFVRRVDDVLAVSVSQVDGRWVASRDNVGDATVWGLEGDLKSGLAWAGLGSDWTLSVNGSVLQSRMTSGPDRGARIPGQARYLATVTVAKPVRATGGWYGGATLTVTGPSQLRTTGTSGRERTRVTLDVHVGSVVRGWGYWRLGVFNVGDAPYRRERHYQDVQRGDVEESSRMTLTPRIYMTVGTRF